DYDNKEILICGWVRSIRSNNNIGFIELNDGSMLKNIQIVIENNLENYSEVCSSPISSTISVKGKVILTPENKQPFEIKALNIFIEGKSNQDYPLQKKKHTFEYLRTIGHLRPRTNTFLSVFRIRSVISYAIHSYFKEQGYEYIHSPIITTSDCEGAGEMFKVTTLDLKDVEKKDNKEVDFSKDFFGKLANLTVSGQLEAEIMALALGKVYTFGPTFRAENSNTSRHAAEFWMIEPEAAFLELFGAMDLAENMLKYVVNVVLNECKQELEFLNNFIDKGLIDRLNNVKNSTFERIEYTEAIEILLKSNKKFEFEVKWGVDLQSEHERYLTENHFKKPIFLYNYPKEIKAFYMRLNDDQKTVASFDCLVPGIGEIIGGSQREERYTVLENRIKECGLPIENYWWYLDLRKYGETKHSGFGLGLERLVMYITGMSNIRDVIPFPRTPQFAEF
ncbi:MAG TPA: asparagine--tRNA ligase, partial [Candidatus Dwaynia gallinarum]|nr:asparagine--tRNA ligase [Candidatus Dwaynia gallinarum]